VQKCDARSKIVFHLTRQKNQGLIFIVTRENAHFALGQCLLRRMFFWHPPSIQRQLYSDLTASGSQMHLMNEQRR